MLEYLYGKMLLSCEFTTYILIHLRVVWCCL